MALNLSGSYDFNETVTRDEVIKEALITLEVISDDQTPSDNQVIRASLMLNKILKSYRATGMLLWLSEWITQVLTASSIVVGSDGNDYICIRPHTGAAGNKPVTGSDYTTYWKDNGTTGDGAVWGTNAYTSINTFSLATEIMGIHEMFVRRDGTDTEVRPMEENEYLQTSNKTDVGMPTNYWFKRELEASTVFLHQYPNDSTDVIHMLVMKKPQDLDDAAENIDVTEEWFLALGAELAYRLSRGYGVPKADREGLKADYLLAKAIASGGDNENADLNISPDFRG